MFHAAITGSIIYFILAVVSAYHSMFGLTMLTLAFAVYLLAYAVVVGIACHRKRKSKEVE